MTLDKRILNFMKCEIKDEEIIRIMGLVKSSEEEWSFRYTFRDGDFLSISEPQIIRCSGLKKELTLLTKKKKKTIRTKKIVKLKK